MFKLSSPTLLKTSGVLTSTYSKIKIQTKCCICWKKRKTQTSVCNWLAMCISQEKLYVWTRQCRLSGGSPKNTMTIRWLLWPSKSRVILTQKELQLIETYDLQLVNFWWKTHTSNQSHRLGHGPLFWALHKQAVTSVILIKTCWSTATIPSKCPMSVMVPAYSTWWCLCISLHGSESKSSPFYIPPHYNTHCGLCKWFAASPKTSPKLRLLKLRTISIRLSKLQAV